ncbi:MAG: DUF4091 domain-containing protein [Armatimonadetes bacterium]|nr:DUF4091 domain-containing protein [Armatimonadota bacterium]
MKDLLFWLCSSMLLGSLAAHAGRIVFDFEKDTDLSAWTLRSKGQDKLQRSPRFATAGESSMVITSPAWKEGMEQWPAVEAKSPIKGWTPYDRLVIDITNPNRERYFLSMFISDGKLPFRDGLSYRFDLASRGFKRFIIPLSLFPEGINRSDISLLHFFSQRPQTDLCLYLDNVTLLRKDEVLPEPDSEFARQVGRLLLEDFGSLDQFVSDCRQAMDKLCDTPKLQRWAQREMTLIEQKISTAREDLSSSDLTLARMTEISEELELVRPRTERRLAVMRYHKEYTAAGLPGNGLLVGFATSMEKIPPRDAPFNLQATKGVELSLARNEKESFQVAILPADRELRKVSVAVTDLKTSRGAVFRRANINCDVVGYVQTRNRPPYHASYVGWWPDPILDFVGPVDIAEGDVQAFWIRLRAPKKQKPGIYRGKLTVSAEGLKPTTFSLTVRVRSFTLPDHSPLPMAITFFEQFDQMGGKDNWQKMKFQYADFLADYYINYDSLYRNEAPDYEIIKHLHDRGRLVAFNLGNVFNGGATTEGFDAQMKQTVDRLQIAYDQAKQLGLLDHAYIYGFDERGQDQFPILEKCAQGLRQAFPEVLLMTTSYDHSFGLESVVKSIDAWCPLTPSFDSERANKARAAGKQVWWYICCGPHNPFANMFVEYAAIEGRLLMGVMTAKYQPEGFLYYSLSIWNDNKPIDKGPFTDWNPISWTVYHGDGSWFCSGPGGKPVPTIRLENFRDGLEDYAYFCLLSEILRKYETKRESLSAKQKEWLAEAREAARVQESLVKSMSEYSRDPAAVYSWRDRVGDLIDRSGMATVNPWGKDFTVRGFSQKSQ